MRVDKVVVGPYENNAYVVRCRRTGEAILVDAANEHELLVPLCRALGVRRVLTTHGHFDHIQAVEACRDAGIDVGVAAEDAKMLPSYDFVIGDEDVIEVGDLKLEAIHTPGHTPGSTSFLLDGEPLLFTGDTLFPGGPGNTVSKARASSRSSPRSTAASSRCRPTCSSSPATASTPRWAPSGRTSRNGSTAAGKPRCPFFRRSMSSAVSHRRKNAEATA